MRSAFVFKNAKGKYFLIRTFRDFLQALLYDGIGGVFRSSYTFAIPSHVYAHSLLLKTEISTPRILLSSPSAQTKSQSPHKAGSDQGRRFLSMNIIQFPFLIDIMSFYFDELFHCLSRLFSFHLFSRLLNRHPDLCDCVFGEERRFSC